MNHKIIVGSNTSLASNVLVFFAVVGFCFVGFIFLRIYNSQNLQATVEISSVLCAAFFSVLSVATGIVNNHITQQNSASLEEFKQVLSLKYPALDDSREAALHYYRTLAKMEIKRLTPEAIDDSEEEMAKAEGLIYLLDEDYQKAWYGFWQFARNISTDYRRMNKLDAQNKWRKTWAHEMGDKLKKIATYQV